MKRYKENTNGQRDKHHEYHKARNQEHLKFNREMLNRLKMEKGCADCGYNEHPAALDFDHRPGEMKSFAISSKKLYPLATILAEVAKCDVVCANCHRIRTYNRPNYNPRQGPAWVPELS